MKKAALKSAWLRLLAMGALVFAFQWAHAAASDLLPVRVERTEDGVFLSTTARFDLPPVVEDALLKGIAMFFVAEADIYRDRWYWTDRRVASAARTIRLAYQPLTRRWRVNSVPGIIGNSIGLRATSNQSYESLPDALLAVQRISRWKIAEAGDVEPAGRHYLEFRFRLDLSQLPRPFQIGVAGQRDWTVGLESTQRLNLEAAKPADIMTKDLSSSLPQEPTR